MKTERRQGIGIVKAEVAIAVGIREGDDTLSAEGAIRVEQIGEPLVSNLRLDGILHGLLAREHRQSQKKQSYEVVNFHHLSISGGKNTNFLAIRVVLRTR